MTTAVCSGNYRRARRLTECNNNNNNKIYGDGQRRQRHRPLLIVPQPPPPTHATVLRAHEAEVPTDRPRATVVTAQCRRRHRHDSSIVHVLLVNARFHDDPQHQRWVSNLIRSQHKIINTMYI